MSGYTIRNLRGDVDDVAVQRGLSPDLEARFAREPLGCEQGAVSYFRYGPGFRGFGHRHKRQEEVYVVVGGSGRVRIDDEVHDVTRWDAVRVAGGTARGFEAGPEGLELVVFGAPNTGPGDGELVDGFWGDAAGR
jgi:mannose-6-phosphate isomerase-like protein (cupin superfamily)